jgi:hypothetical protein
MEEQQNNANVQATESVEEISRRTFTARTPDHTYTVHWNKFCSWVDSTAGVNRTPDGKYLTRDNIDKYFLLYVQNQHIKWKPKHAKKARFALQFYANNQEYPQQIFNVNSVQVEQALRMHHDKHKKHGPNKIGCAHANLPTDVLSNEEETTLIMYGAQQPSWGNYCASFTCMTQTTIRGEQIRNSRLCDLHCDEVHGPPSGANNNFPMIALIQQPYVGKQGGDRKRVAGMWRHAEWWKCGTRLDSGSPDVQTL